MIQRTQLLVSLLLAAATVVVYAPVAGFGFVGFDDPGYVAGNEMVRRGLTAEGLRWAFTTGTKANWHPLTWLSLMLDVELFGVDPGAMHLVNLGLHAADVVLLFLLLARITARTLPSATVAALFALHPLHVESVAWISERKDVLSTLFGLLAILAYARWVERRGAGRYAASLALFALSLMAKPMLVTLPFVLLLLDYWPLGRTALAATPTGAPAPHRGAERPGSLLLEKAPFFVLAALSSAVTLAAQRAGGAIADAATLPLATRIAGALVGYAWYLQSALWPTDLAVLYPNPALAGAGFGTARVVLAAALLLAASALVVRRARREPYLLVGWLWFLGTLVPVIGLVQVGQQATADRYGYVPAIGLYLMAAFGLADATARRRVPRVAVGAAALVVAIACAAAARAQLAHWRSARTLAERAVAVTRDNYVMHFNLAVALDADGEHEAALVHYRRAVDLRPDLAAFRLNLGAALARAGRIDEAVAHYRTAIRLDPGDPAAYNNLAWLRATHPRARERDAAEALRVARVALELTGEDDPRALDALAAALAESGRFDAAAERAQQALAAAGDGCEARQIARRLALYRARRAYREAPATPDPCATPAPAR